MCCHAKPPVWRAIIRLSVRCALVRCARFQHTVVFAQRGKYTLGRLYGRVHPATDLQPWLFESRRSRSVAYTRVVPLPRHLPPLHTYASFGHYVSPSAGEGLEFAGYANIAAAIGSGVCTGAPPWPGNSST